MLRQGTTRSKWHYFCHLKACGDLRSGKLTEGIVQKLLTNSEVHPRGIKVMLEDGIVGRVKKIK
ncbi:YwbE family protein [Clostridium sp. MSJ-4]|uniref:YwbE family protein n=1 Tax=Clostridium simiarum TaxID=2841506 RepID=A0ABS6F272_9CLOT|nr:YwbE family protein [Clostridium simiarum]